MDGFQFYQPKTTHVGVKPITRSNERIEAQLATGNRLREEAFRLRYEAYRSQGFISEHPARLFSDRYDQQANCTTILVYRNDVAAATVRVSTFDPDKARESANRLQAMEIFETEIFATMKSLRLSDRQPKIMEIAKLARLPEYSREIDVVFALYRAAGYLILQNSVDIVFNAVRSHHAPMYRRFGFQALTGPRSYPGLAFQTILMACFSDTFDKARTGLPFLHGISKDDAAYAGLIAGERVAIFGDEDANLVRPAAPAAPLSQRPDGLRRSA
jgi:hypothetical protein